MSRLLVITRPDLVLGFQLAGVDAFAAEDGEAAGVLVAEWLDAREAGLLAIDERLLSSLKHGVRERLESSDHLLYLAIPSGERVSERRSRQQQIAQMIRRAIGVHITFGETDS